MAHSIELVFDTDTEAMIRRIWADLAAAGVPGQTPASRPHVTLAVAEHIDPAVDVDLLTVAGAQLPLACTLGAALLFGRSHAILARLVVPDADLLALHAQVARLSQPRLTPGPKPHSAPGHWTPHVTCARRVAPAQLGPALPIVNRPVLIAGHFVGLRRWDGTNRVEHLLRG